jgi:hypothetical protein
MNELISHESITKKFTDRITEEMKNDKYGPNHYPQTIKMINDLTKAYITELNGLKYINTKPRPDIEEMVLTISEIIKKEKEGIYTTRDAIKMLDGLNKKYFTGLNSMELYISFMLKTILDCDIPRMRGSYFVEWNDKICILLNTRTGGNNWNQYRKQNMKLIQHKLCIDNKQDEDDSTYHEFYFDMSNFDINILNEYFDVGPITSENSDE